MGRKRADVVLVERGLFDSRAKARAAIEAGGVVVDGRTLAKASELVDEAAAIEAVSQGVLGASIRAGKGARALGLYEQRFTREVNCAKVIDQIEQAAKERT